MKGRKPVPTHLKLMTGNPGRRPINDAEPVAVGDLTEPPEWFDDEMREEWHYALEHAPLGLVKKIERATLSVYIVAFVTLRRAVLAQREFDSSRDLKLVAETPNGMPIASPYIGIMNRQAQILLKAASELGFTPSSRTRIKLDGAQKKGSALEKAIGG